MHASARWALTGIMLVVPVIGCGSAPERSRAFVVGEEIPLGILSVTVDRIEQAARVAPLVALDPPAGEKAKAIWVRWSGLGDFEERARQTFAATVLRHRLRIVDSGGFDYPAITALEPELYHWSGRPGPAGRTRVVIFWVPVDSEEYTLLIEHPDPGEDDFEVALVPLR
jgi:hypothetical protein